MTGDYYRRWDIPTSISATADSFKGMVDGLGRTSGLAGSEHQDHPGHGDTVDRTPWPAT